MKEAIAKQVYDICGEWPMVDCGESFVIISIGTWHRLLRGDIQSQIPKVLQERVA